MNDIEIKFADAADANLIHVLAGATFYAAYYEQDNPPNLANYIVEAFDRSKILAELADADATFLIVYFKQKAVGYAKLRENSKPPGIAAENTIELQRIYVLPQVYGAGAGESLLYECLREAARRKRQTVWLGVWEENLRAQKFYRKHGFKTIGQISFPYGNEVGTNLVLEKSLL